MSEEITIKLGGKAIYIAVKEYMNKQMDAQIKQEIERIIQDMNLKSIISTRVNKELEDSINYRVRDNIDTMLISTISDKLAGMIEVNVLTEDKYGRDS